MGTDGGTSAGFLRAPLAQWNGPVNAWSDFSPSGPGPWSETTAVRRSGAFRSWPLRFRDADGLRQVWDRLLEFAGPGARVVAHLGGGVGMVDSVEALLAQPDRALGHVRFEAERLEETGELGVRRSFSASVEFRSSPTHVRTGAASRRAFVVCEAVTPVQPGPDDSIAADAFRDLLESLCVPMTRWDLRRKRPVLERRTEAESRAERRALWSGVWVGVVATVVGGLLLLLLGGWLGFNK